MKQDKELLFSVTAKDCIWQPVRGSGPGGQHRNKVYTGMRCTHPPSGAVGVATDDRSQKVNKRQAFLRMIKTDKFKSWYRLEIARITGEEARIQSVVDSMMKPKNIKTEVKSEDGTWKQTTVQV